jgi:predicted RNA-binding protein with PIN domain
MIIIDGHNLIGKISSINLNEADDEMHLIKLLQVYCRVKQRSIEVYFDGAPPGYARKQQFGRVKANFIARQFNADDAIINQLQKLGHKARNTVIVTSDRRIQAQARSVQARVITAEEFATEVMEAQRLAFDQTSGEASVMSSEEMNEWLRLFDEKKKKSS